MGDSKRSGEGDLKRSGEGDLKHSGVDDSKCSGEAEGWAEINDGPEEVTL